MGVMVEDFSQGQKDIKISLNKVVHSTKTLQLMEVCSSSATGLGITWEYLHHTIFLTSLSLCYLFRYFDDYW